MYASAPPSRGGMPPPMPPPHQRFHHAAAPARSSAWDSDDVVYVGMEYSNMGACSQNAPASYHPGSSAGGCSQKKIASFNPNSAGRGLGDYGGGGVGTSASSAGTFVRAMPHPPRPEALSSASPAFMPPSVSAPHEVSQPADCCQVEGCVDVALRIGGVSRGVLCASHLRDGMQRVAHNDRIYGTHRSSLNPEDITRPIYDNQCKAEPGTACALLGAKQEPTTAPPVSWSKHDFPPPGQLETKPDISGLGAVTPPNIGMCEHPGCSKTPRYGHTDAPLTLCQSHKRAGMYTTRDGRLLVSTRDGNGIRKAASPPTAAVGAALARAPAQRAPKSERESTDPGWSPSSSGSQSMYRKLCEVKGCQVQPSYGLSGTSRPRFCCEHKSKGMVGLKNRPCLFPGCLTRPHYGLTQGRAVYCATHKKAGMVHLLKESLTMEKERIARNRELSRQQVGERKRRQQAAASSSSVAKCSSDVLYDDEEEEWTEESERRSLASSKGKGKSKAFSTSGGSSSSSSSSSGKGKKVPVGKNGRRRSWGAAPTRSPVPWSSASSSWSPDEDEEPPDMPNDEDATSGSQRYSRLADGAGIMAPSVEIRLLQQARESARAAAEASGSGRRARAPSRKLLEASGALDNENAQWMTREIKEADAKVKKELREKRKHSKSAGLKAGEVLEACSGPQADGGDAMARTGAGGGNSSSGGGGGGGRVLSSKQSCQELKPAPGKQQRRTVGVSVATPNTISAKKEPVEAATGDFPMKRTWVVREGGSTSGNGGGGGSGARKGGSATTKGDAAPPKPKRSRDDRGLVSEAGGGVVAGKGQAWGGVGEERTEDSEAGGRGGLTKCEYGDCSKTASFGVNGTVRYCKSHRLFGMHEILQSR